MRIWAPCAALMFGVAQMRNVWLPQVNPEGGPKAPSTGDSNAPVQPCCDGDAGLAPFACGVAVVVLRTETPKMCSPGSHVLTPPEPVVIAALAVFPTSGSVTDAILHDPMTGTENA